MTALALTSCQSQSDVPAVRRVFASFEYVGETVPVQNCLRVGEHGNQPQPFPAKLAAGRQYVFHRRKGNVNPWVEIEHALRATGAIVTEAPHGNQGLVYTYVGGPWFVIQFKLGQINGTIQNFPARELGGAKMAQDLEPEDFVLTTT